MVREADPTYYGTRSIRTADPTYFLVDGVSLHYDHFHSTAVAERSIERGIHHGWASAREESEL